MIGEFRTKTDTSRLDSGV